MRAAPLVSLLISLLPALLLAACGAESGPDAQASRQQARSVLLITLDTTRPDHLGTYGYARPTSPVIDALAARGVVFESCWASAPETGPSLASVMTSRRAPVTGVRANAERLAADLPTLAETAREAGLRTAAFVSTVLLSDRASGLARGFDHYDAEMTDPCFGHARAQRIAERTVDQALAWIGSDTRPYFVWVHLYDPHGPYTPPAVTPRLDATRPSVATRELAQEQIPRYQRVADTHAEADAHAEADTHEAAEYVDRYDREIAYMDRELGRLLEGVDTAQTLIAVHADHGEALGEDDYWFRHGALLHDAALRVPLIFAGPGVPSGGRRVDPVRNLDLAPTLLALAGLPPLAQAEGHDLTACVTAGSPAPPLELIAEARRREDTRDRTGIDMRWKLRYLRIGHAGGDGDGDGDGDRSFWPGEEPTGLPEPVRAWLVEPERAAAVVEPEPPSKEDLEALESLGYK